MNVRFDEYCAISLQSIDDKKMVKKNFIAIVITAFLDNLIILTGRPPVEYPRVWTCK